jgi:hypothetical protein
VNIRPLPPGVQDFYDRFVEALRRRDLKMAQDMAPDVLIETHGWPYKNETGPLNPDAFQGDKRLHRIMFWEEAGPDTYELQSGVAYYTIRVHGGRYQIIRAGLKPIE